MRKRAGIILIGILILSGFIMLSLDTQALESEPRDLLHKVWVVKEEDRDSGGFFLNPSFALNRIENGQAEGFLLGESVQWGISSERKPYFLLKGTIRDGYIEGEFTYEGTKGIFRIDVLTEDRVQMYLKYVGENRIWNKTYELQPLKYGESEVNMNIGGLIEERNLVFPVEIDTWGQVYIRTGARNPHKLVPVVYLTDQEGNVYQELDFNYLSGMEFKEVRIADLNQDGLDDIELGLAFMDSEEVPVYYRFTQTDTGYFYCTDVEFMEGY